ncbi:MAG TPA: heavy metal-responsive transcriptional regulator [Burkholderiales bacterium]|nr:heavy metal-responsive transcriptional regulator [Burkholderiales bacterium]
MDTVSIGTLAKDLGLGAGTLRYYERRGLLSPAQRTASGYRMYDRDAAQRLRFIRRAQALGFSLEEIAELLALHDNPHASARRVKRLTEARITDLATRIRDLERMKQALEVLAASCSGRGQTRECPILAALDRDDE